MEGKIIIMHWREPKPAAAILEAVEIAAIDAMGNEARSVSQRLQDIHRTNAIVRRVLRRAAHYAEQASVDEAALVEYLKGKLL